MGMTPKQDGPVDWGVSRTKQSEEASTNINNIIRRYTRTGELTHVSESLGEYRDMSGIPSLHEAMNRVAAAHSLFQELPAHIRKRVGHDVGNFLPFIDDPANLVECIDLGLLPKSLLPKQEKSVPSEPTEEATPMPTPPIIGGE